MWGKLPSLPRLDAHRTTSRLAGVRGDKSESEARLRSVCVEPRQAGQLTPRRNLLFPNRGTLYLISSIASTLTGPTHANPHHRRGRVHRLAPVRTLPRRGARGHLPSTTSSPARPANIEHLRGNPTLHASSRHDISHPLEIDGPIDNVLHFASPGQPGRLPRATRSRRSRSARSARTTRSAWPRRRRPATCWPAPARSTATRSDHPQTRGLLGQRQPDRRPRRATTRPSASPRR